MLAPPLKKSSINKNIQTFIDANMNDEHTQLSHIACSIIYELN